MDKYIPPFDVTNQMLNLVALIAEKVGQFRTNYKDLESRPKLRRNNRIRSIYSSLAIEANPLSLNEVTAVINGKLVLGSQKEIREVQNAYQAYELLGNFNPYSIQDLKKIHNVMTKFLIDESGNFRRGEEGIFDGDKCIFIAPPAKLVPHLMKDLFNWLNEIKDKLHLLIVSSIFHYEFVFIHPFSDGNGRMARLWQTALLTEWRQLFQYLPLENQIQKFQNEYYTAISQSHKTGKSNVFVEFMLKKIYEILNEIEDSLTKENKAK